MDLQSLLQQAWLVPAGQMLLGKLVKSHPNIKNELIPFCNLLAAVLGFSIVESNAPGTGADKAWVVAALSSASTVLATGVHSLSKNALGPVVGRILGLFGLVKSSPPSAPAA